MPLLGQSVGVGSLVLISTHRHAPSTISHILEYHPAPCAPPFSPLGPRPSPFAPPLRGSPSTLHPSPSTLHRPSSIVPSPPNPPHDPPHPHRTTPHITLTSQGKAPTHHHVHHAALTPSHAVSALTSQGMLDVRAELRGDLPVFGHKGDGRGGEEVPCLVAWGRVPR